jgi:hypothetical protein
VYRSETKIEKELENKYNKPNQITEYINFNA